MISNMKAARLLGWTSVAVGLTEIAATRWIEEEMGIENHDTLLRLYGAREIGVGLEILRQPGLNKTLAGALWARVAGDALDIGTLCAAASRTKNRNGLISIVAIVLAITGLDILVAGLITKDLAKGAAISEQARNRVTPTQAVPQPVQGHVENAAAELPISIGNG